jgi:hypothetical protein
MKLVAVGTIINLNLIDMPWSKIQPQPKLNMLGEHSREDHKAKGNPRALSEF